MIKKNEIFFEKTIEGRRFIGWMTQWGPYLSGPDADGGQKSVPLGSTPSIDRLEDGRIAVCKYGPREPRIHLDGMSDEGMTELAVDFGIEVMGALIGPNFWNSRAFAGLTAWTLRHPRKAKSLAGKESYARGWHVAATAVGAAHA